MDRKCTDQHTLHSNTMIHYSRGIGLHSTQAKIFTMIGFRVDRANFVLSETIEFGRHVASFASANNSHAHKISAQVVQYDQKHKRLNQN